MLSFSTEFDDAKNQIELYLNFVEKIEIYNYVNLASPSEPDCYIINSDLTTILKANAFLMLYNIIEATIKNCLWEVFTSIKSDGIKFQQLNIEIQNIILLSKVKTDFKTKDSTLASQIQAIIENVLNNLESLFPIDKQKIKFETGNLKMKNIQNTFKSHGLNQILENHSNQVEAFKITVTNRNSLAHGDKTFKECGKDYSLIQLRGYQEQIFEYLSKCITETESYITMRNYARKEINSN